MSERLVLLNANYSNHNSRDGNVPSNEAAILNFIQEQKKSDKEPGETTVVLIDTIWGDRFDENEYGAENNEQLAEHLGMRAAFHTRIDDAFLNKKGWKKDVGITVATDHEVSSAEVMRLGYDERARNALVMELTIGSKALTLSALYLPEDNQHAQWDHVVDLDRKLNGENPSRKPKGHQIIAGDFNALGRRDTYEGLLRIGSSLVHGAAWFVEATKNPGDRNYWEKTLVSLDTRKVIPHMRTLGYKRVRTDPTYSGPLPFDALDPDAIFTFDVQNQGAKTVNKNVSDHKPIVFDFDIR